MMKTLNTPLFIQMKKKKQNRKDLKNDKSKSGLPLYRIFLKFST